MFAALAIWLLFFGATLFYNTAHRLRDAIIAQVRGCPKEIDMVSWMGRTALEIIGQVGLGHSFDPLTADSDNKYGDALKSLTPQIDQVHELRRALPYIYWWGPAWFRRWMLKMVPNKHVQNAIPIVDVMDRKSREIFEAKVAAMEGGEETVLRQVEKGKDIMSILIKANNAASETDRLCSEEIIAQMSTFVFAATDSTSNTLARILQLLALHPEIQEKLRKEILEAHAGDHLPYDELASLPLLDAVCRETLRVYPPGTTLTREPRKDVVMPLSEPIRGRDGKMISEVPIPKGTEIIVGTIGINCSKALWGEDASEWRPERWLSPLPDALSNARVPGVYSNLMTFHGGKRACIGFKFSETEMKCIMSVLLTNFIFELSNKPIYWNVAGAWYPSVGKDSDQPQMPLKVSMYGGGSSG
uniref:Cytochrome P450 monooxygenase n=1 Tax=Taiwanofungus camphoratus TaxID=2696576 RepID=H9LFA3_TAICA|nr:cytochrome P450 monooxygenase [Antrodia cinnamomea]